MLSNLTGLYTATDIEKRRLFVKPEGNKYHWNVTEPLDDINPLFVRKMPIWKRAMDICFSLVGIIMLLPLLIIAGIYIKLVSPGPIFFKQERVGYGGKIFSMIKLRTMHPNADKTLHRKHMIEIINGDDAKNLYKPISKLPNDPRIIPFCKFIRTTAIDELPQLFNILVGDMSLVGPRPPIPYEVDEYKYWHADRFDTVPGLTGLWQVSGKNRLPFNEMIRLDIRYIQTQSFWLDLKILLLTPSAVISQFRDPQGNF
ncbi:MAG: UDP-phosphate galactose phosphotransferase [Flavobacterium sp.]|nr:UDP-phosphate galactose phosphotransferase [Flavobacterium sp.]